MPTRATIFKITRQDLTTHNGYLWVPGERRAFPGTGELCGPGWCHAYTHPGLALLLNPVHANYSPCRLWQGTGIIGRTDRGLKVGLSECTLLQELEIPLVTIEQRVIFGLLCALQVYSEPSFVTYAVDWIDGTARAAAEAAMASAMATAAAEAAMASAMATAAAEAAMASAMATASAEAAWAAARAAAWAAAWAAEAADVDLHALADAVVPWIKELSHL